MPTSARAFTCLSTALVLALGWLGGAARLHAASGDANAPLEILPKGSVDYLPGRVVMNGPVRIQRGSLRIDAPLRVEAREPETGHHLLRALGSAAQPVRFEMARDVPGERYVGEAAQADYDSDTSLLRLSGSPVVRLMRGEALQSEVRGAVLIYNHRSQAFRVEGEAAGQTQPPSDTRILLMPRPSPASSPIRP